MTKLSRKDKYRDLRQSIELESEQVSASIRPGRPSRMAAPDLRSEARSKTPGSEDSNPNNPVLEDLLGEVKQYNMDNGDLVTEDTQLQILHDLSYGQKADARRSDYIEKMEQNEDAGGTTRNLYGSDLSAIVSAASKTSPSPAKKPAITMPEKPAQAKNTDSLKASSSADTENFSMQADESVDPDYLDLFTPQKASFEEVVQVEQTYSSAKEAGGKGRSKKNRNARKARSKNTGRTRNNIDQLDELFETAQIPAASMRQQEFQGSRSAAALSPQEISAADLPNLNSEAAMSDEDYFGSKKAGRKSRKPQPGNGRDSSPEKSSTSKVATIIMLVCCVILVILIILTVFWMSQLGLLS